MDYILKKYRGQSMIDTDYLQYELLLNNSQTLLIKKEVREILNVSRTPSEISFEMFNDLIDRHL